jgi:hypothetical protein
MKLSGLYSILFFAVVAVFSCKERYVAPVQAARNTNFLVVEGDINAGQDSTIIKLSFATPLTDTTKQIVPVDGAAVAVETDAGRNFPLTGLGNGLYGTDYIAAGAAGEKYRLSIQTAAGRKYLSDYVVLKNAPPIDSISWEQLPDGVHIYANTHDNGNNTRYYKWNFTETWKYNAPFESLFLYVNGNFVPRPPPSIFTCWQNIPATAIVVLSTNNLVQDVVYKKQLVFIPTSDYKISIMYSILVKQTALTADGYNYWTGLSKNTEQLGSIFDALPSQLQGNVYSVTDPSETVIGFISATTTQQQRIFIKKEQVNNWVYLTGTAACDTVLLTTPATLALAANGSLLVINSTQPLNPFAPYYGVDPQCADCRLKGGTLTKPPFWP